MSCPQHLSLLCQKTNQTAPLPVQNELQIKGKLPEQASFELGQIMLKKGDYVLFSNQLNRWLQKYGWVGAVALYYDPKLLVDEHNLNAVAEALNLFPQILQLAKKDVFQENNLQADLALLLCQNGLPITELHKLCFQQPFKKIKPLIPKIMRDYVELAKQNLLDENAYQNLRVLFDLSDKKISDLLKEIDYELIVDENFIKLLSETELLGLLRETLTSGKIDLALTVLEYCSPDFFEKNKNSLTTWYLTDNAMGEFTKEILPAYQQQGIVALDEWLLKFDQVKATKSKTIDGKKDAKRICLAWRFLLQLKDPSVPPAPPPLLADFLFGDRIIPGASSFVGKVMAQIPPPEVAAALEYASQAVPKGSTISMRRYLVEKLTTAAWQSMTNPTAFLEQQLATTLPYDEPEQKAARQLAVVAFYLRNQQEAAAQELVDQYFQEQLQLLKERDQRGGSEYAKEIININDGTVQPWLQNPLIKTKATEYFRSSHAKLPTPLARWLNTKFFWDFARYTENTDLLQEIWQKEKETLENAVTHKLYSPTPNTTDGENRSLKFIINHFQKNAKTLLSNATQEREFLEFLARVGNTPDFAGSPLQKQILDAIFFFAPSQIKKSSEVTRFLFNSSSPNQRVFKLAKDTVQKNKESDSYHHQQTVRLAQIYINKCLQAKNKF